MANVSRIAFSKMEIVLNCNDESQNAYSLTHTTSLVSPHNLLFEMVTVEE